MGRVPQPVVYRLMVNFARVAWQVDRHVVVYDANFRRCDGEQCFYGVIKDNYGPTKLLAASDRAWLGRPQPPPARAMWRSLFPSAAKVEVDNAWLCELQEM